MTPETVAARSAAALVLGLGLGLVYDLLRPLRPRHTAFADTLFVLAALWSWLVLGFRVCQADLRLGYSAALGGGWLLWQALPGRLLQPVIFRIWGLLTRFVQFIFRPVKNIFKKSKKNIK